MSVFRVATARLWADKRYKEGFTGEFRCRNCDKTQEHDLFTVALKGDREQVVLRRAGP